MARQNTPVLDFLNGRRSFPAIALRPPVPDREEIAALLTAAARSPDHGKLEPWRFLVIERPAMQRLASRLIARGLEMGKAQSLVEKAGAVFSDANLVIAVVSSPDREAKIPAIEQTLSAGAVCLSLLNAALASGWGANWVTGFGAHDAEFRESALGLDSHETIAGFVHIGTARTVPPDRPRPDIAAITEWVAN